MPPMYCWPWGELRLVMHCVHFGLVLAGPIIPVTESRLHKDWCKFFNLCPNACYDCVHRNFCANPSKGGRTNREVACSVPIILAAQKNQAPIF